MIFVYKYIFEKQFKRKKQFFNWQVKISKFPSKTFLVLYIALPVSLLITKRPLLKWSIHRAANHFIKIWFFKFTLLRLETLVLKSECEFWVIGAKVYDRLLTADIRGSCSYCNILISLIVTLVIIFFTHFAIW